MFIRRRVRCDLLTAFFADLVLFDLTEDCRLEDAFPEHLCLPKIPPFVSAGSLIPKSEASNIILGKNIENVVIIFMERSTCVYIIQMWGA